ncbi:MAG: methyltransferase [Candidatus Krumholzibacteriia bacterium]
MQNPIRRAVPLPVRRWLLHRTRRPPVGRVDLGDLRRLAPISRAWGGDRGLPVDRYYIERFLAAHADDVRGRVLEIGDDSYTRRFGGPRVSRRDVLHTTAGNPHATFVDDLASGETLPAAAFDCIILTQTQHLIADLKGPLETVRRILRPGGVVLATLPGISQICRDETAPRGDYWRFTTHSARHLYEQVFPAGDLRIESHGNVLAAVAFLHGLATSELSAEELDCNDPDYQVLVTVRAVKPGGGES